MAPDIVGHLVDGYIIGRKSQARNRGVVANLDIDIVCARFEEECVPSRIELTGRQRLNLRDGIHRALNIVGGHARIEDSHVRSKVRLNLMSQTECTD